MLSGSSVDVDGDSARKKAAKLRATCCVVTGDRRRPTKAATLILSASSLSSRPRKGHAGFSSSSGEAASRDSFDPIRSAMNGGNR